MASGGALLIVAVGEVHQFAHLFEPIVDRGAVVVLANNREAAALALFESPRTSGLPEVSFRGLTVVPAEGRVLWNGRRLRLSSSEQRMLFVLAASPGRGFSFAELTEAAWGAAYLGDSSALRSAVKRLRRKLMDGTAGEIVIESVWGTGFRLNSREP